MQPGTISPRGGFSKLRTRALVFCLAVGLCYANSLGVPFLFDDPLPGTRLDYSTRPLVWASFALNRTLGGGALWGFHVFNALVHLAAGFLLFGVLRQILASTGKLAPSTGEGLAFVATLLWLCHPLQTSSVTYLSQRAEAMGAVFYLGLLYTFLRSAVATRPWGWQSLALAALALGFATKETIATAPIAVLLLDSILLSRGPLAALRSRPGFYAALALVTLALASYFVVPLLGAGRISAGFKLAEVSPLEYARTQPGVVLHYLRLAFWPHALCFDYDWPVAREPLDWVPQGAAVAALLAAVLFLCLRRSWIGFASACFFLVLAPSSSFVPIRDLAVDHRAYLPLAAVLVLVVVGAWWCLERLGRGARAAKPLLALVAALALASMTIRRNRDYRSAEVLWRQTTEQAPRNGRAYACLGSSLLADGRTEEALAELMKGLSVDPSEGFLHLKLGEAYLGMGEVDHAISFLKSGVRLREEPEGLKTLGRALFKNGNSSEAALYFQKAVELDSSDPDAHYGLANVLAQLGRAEEGVQHFQEALRLEPAFQEAHINLAALLAWLGRPGEALEHSLEAFAIAPNSALELFNLAQSLRELGRLEEALDALREACRVDPGLPDPCVAFAEIVGMLPSPSSEERSEALRMALRANELSSSSNAEYLALLAQALEAVTASSTDPRDTELVGRALAVQGDDRGALLELERALARDPSDAVTHAALAGVLVRTGRAREAEEHYAEALRLAPEYEHAHLGLAALLDGQGMMAEALEHYERALSIPPNSAEEHFSLARMLRALGRLEEAEAVFLVTCHLAPELPAPHAAFAEAVCARPDASPEERREALRHARRANELSNSKQAEFLEIWARAQAALGDFAGAAARLEQALELPSAGQDPDLAGRLRSQREAYRNAAGR